MHETCFILPFYYFTFLSRHVELEKDKQREKKLQKMKKNLKLLMIALIVLAIEKLSEFITALIRGSHPNHAATLVSLIFSAECLKKRPFIVEKLMLLNDIQILIIIIHPVQCCT